ncbi:IS1182 family transposase [bacterium]|nr:IS1182 family transposase [bacterium]
MAYIKSFKDQNWLLPPSLSDLIPKDHVCLLIESFIDQQDFSSFDIQYSGAGHPAYHPRIILKLLVMGVLDKVRSSRKLARNARENIVYMYLSEKLCPDFRTISDFRKDNPTIVKKAFQHTITLAKSEGMLDLSNLATDGTRIKANASNRKVLSEEELIFLMKFVDNELDEWAKQDSLEDDFFEDLRGSDQLPKSSKKKMQKAVKHYISKLKEKGEPFKLRLQNNLKQANKELVENELAKVNTTDPESRFMPSKKGKIEFLYNPQITTERNGFIIANDVCNDADDHRQLKPQVSQTKENLKEIPNYVKWSFDNGYMGGDNISFLNSLNIDAYIACQKEKSDKPYDKSNFKYNKEKDEYICPKGKLIVFQRVGFDKGKKKNLRLYKGTSCQTCPSQTHCTKRKDGVRYIKMFPFEEESRQMKTKMLTEKAKETYKLRKQIVEFVFGDFRENKGLVAFLTRSLETVRTEFNLMSLASNLGKIWRKNLEKLEKIREDIILEIKKKICSLYPNLIVGQPLKVGGTTKTESLCTRNPLDFFVLNPNKILGEFFNKNNNYINHLNLTNIK